MKTLLLATMALLMASCTTYTTQRINDETVMVSKTTTVFFFFGGTVYTCALDENKVIKTCVENNVESEQVKLERSKREASQKNMSAGH